MSNLKIGSKVVIERSSLTPNSHRYIGPYSIIGETKKCWKVKTQYGHSLYVKDTLNEYGTKNSWHGSNIKEYDPIVHDPIFAQQKLLREARKVLIMVKEIHPSKLTFEDVNQLKNIIENANKVSI